MSYTPREVDILVRKARSALSAARYHARVHPNTAAARAYYAVHSAIKARTGLELRPHKLPWTPDTIQKAGLAPEDGADVHLLYQSRIHADYSQTRWVAESEASARVQTASQLLSRLNIP